MDGITTSDRSPRRVQQWAEFEHQRLQHAQELEAIKIIRIRELVALVMRDAREVAKASDVEIANYVADIEGLTRDMCSDLEAATARRFQRPQ